MSDQHAALEECQSVLLETLYDCDDLETIRERLRIRLPDSSYRAWIDSFDDRMLSLAAALTKQWGRRRP